MITNPKVIPKNKKYYCGEKVARWLIFKRKLPILAIEKNKYIFAQTDSLKKALEEMPLYLKIFG